MHNFITNDVLVYNEILWKQQSILNGQSISNVSYHLMWEDKEHAGLVFLYIWNRLIAFNLNVYIENTTLYYRKYYTILIESS